MGNYKPDLSCKSIFIQVDFVQQIIPGTFEYALSHIVDKHIDLSLFDKWYDNDKGGAAAYSPSVMLKIVLFGYSGEVVSSRFKKFVTICNYIVKSYHWFPSGLLLLYSIANYFSHTTCNYMVSRLNRKHI